MVKLLAREGYQVITLDNLSTGHRDAVLAGEFVQGELSDHVLLRGIFGTHTIAAVMHFASSIQVGESITAPAKYYANNVSATLVLLDVMREYGLKRFIFSSSAAVYGNPQTPLINEEHAKSPINPYGRSKWIVEQILADYDRAYGLKSISLRYFNAAGADPEGQLGERHQPETHLIPLVLQAAMGGSAELAVFGDDYDTPDGSCIRDYVHIADLCQAHLLALRKLLRGENSATFNLGNGAGFSVKEVLSAAQRVTGKEIPYVIKSRREGDPPRLVADARLAVRALNWQPQYADLETIIRHAWAWECRDKNRGH